MTIAKTYFTSQLLRWNKQVNKREMPWKGEKDPYRIWLSEIILQQTRVEQGINYYNRMVAAFPTVEKLANAPELKVFKLWEGLGYYTRCKNLIATAKIIVQHYHGIFPSKYDELLALKGVGPYTAAAIASFAFNQPYAVVDGNVFRVLSRYFGIHTAIDSTIGKKMFTILANELLSKKNAGDYNQALMDFGATICKPQLPNCKNCPVKNKCDALLTDRISILPFKEKKIVNKIRWFYYLVVEHKGKLYVRKRGAKDIWENLYEFILFESNKEILLKSLQSLAFAKEVMAGNKYHLISISDPGLQQLTHQTIKGRMIRIQTESLFEISGYQAITRQQLKKLPFPKYLAAFVKENYQTR